MERSNPRGWLGFWPGLGPTTPVLWGSLGKQYGEWKSSFGKDSKRVAMTYGLLEEDIF